MDQGQGRSRMATRRVADRSGMDARHAGLRRTHQKLCGRMPPAWIEKISAMDGG